MFVGLREVAARPEVEIVVETKVEYSPFYSLLVGLTGDITMFGFCFKKFHTRKNKRHEANCKYRAPEQCS